MIIRWARERSALRHRRNLTSRDPTGSDGKINIVRVTVRDLRIRFASRRFNVTEVSATGPLDKNRPSIKFWIWDDSGRTKEFKRSSRLSEGYAVARAQHRQSDVQPKIRADATIWDVLYALPSRF